MYNYHIFIVLYAAWVVLGAATALAIILGKAFKAPLEPPPAEPPQAVGPTASHPVLDYARPVVKQSPYRKRPWLAGFVALLEVIILISIPAVPMIGIWLASDMLFMYALAAIVATSIAVIATGMVVWRALKRREDKPAAALWPRRKLLVTWICGVPALMLVLFLLDLGTKHRLRQLRAEMDAQSTSLFQAVPQGMPNAAEKYRQAFALIAAADPKLLDWSPRYSSYSSPSAPPELPVGLNEAASILREASQIPVTDWGIAPTSYAGLAPLPHLAPLRTSTRLLGMHAVREAQLGHTDLAIRGILAMRMMAKNSMQPLCLIEWSVSMGIESTANSTVEDTLPLLNDEQLLDQLVTSPDVDGRKRTTTMLRGEQALSLRMLANIYDGRIGGLTPAQAKAVAVQVSLMRVFWADLETRGMRRFFDDAVACVTDEPAETLDRAGKVDATMGVRRQQGGILSSILMPSISAALRTPVDLEMRRQLTNVGIAARRYYLRNGRLPASLDELVSAGLINQVPIDVFDGKPIRLKVNRDEVVIYSVGRDGRDNGGDYTVNKDMTFRVGTKPLWEIDLANMPPREQVPESSR